MLKLKSLFNKLNVSDKNSDKNTNLKNINHGNCSYCNEPFTEELWCKECDPFRMIEVWTSGNNVIDKFIKDTIYDVRNTGYSTFLEWVPFDKFKDIKQIGEGGFAKVYSATWIDGEAVYEKQDDGSWKKREPESLTVALKRLNGSQNMSIEYLNELKTHWNFNKDNLYKYYQEIEKYGYKGKEVKAAFEEADKEIPNISTSYKKNPEAIYTSRLFTFNNLTKPVNSSIITSYLDDEENNNEVNQDSQLVDLEVPSSLLQSKGNKHSRDGLLNQLQIMNS
ncbi:kinase-like domain-containing protein [Rhizophagus clarus]|uniref:Kinase-like domain-containing protein n=1 Tax=Rhizophagus clarus TaxID=94130 RepID=A0A8H3KZN3_9GLOM|nr:kinase-like domain-containing protein [Rhizophagus clarus]